MAKRRPHNFKDLTGEKFGRLTVIKEMGVKNEKVIWLCKCECGEYTTVPTGGLKIGDHKSCGCLNRELSLLRSRKHGMTSSGKRHRLYTIYHDMKDRCFNKNSKIYKYYGGRGITVCEQWLNSLDDFKNWALENGYDDSLEIDRINNDGNYEPLNCRWVTRSQNCLNKGNNRLITINGITRPITLWANLSGVSRSAIEGRIKRGWDNKDLLKPVGKRA